MAATAGQPRVVQRWCWAARVGCVAMHCSGDPGSEYGVERRDGRKSLEARAGGDEGASRKQESPHQCVESVAA
jgi:hypothetical protein